MSATTDATAAPGHRTADRAAAEPRRKAGARSKKSQNARRLKCQASQRFSLRYCRRSRSTRRRPYKNVLRPALAEAGLPASRPATTAPDSAPAVGGVRLHDL